MRLFFALAMFSASLAAAEAELEQAIDIPLKSIWASVIPGTKLATDLDPEIAKSSEYAQSKSRSALGQVLAHKLRDKSRLFGTAFALAQFDLRSSLPSRILG